MEIFKTKLEGVLEIIPKAFFDDRGYFFEFYRESGFAKAGISCRFVQENESMSRKNVLRGLHFQRKPHAQSKLIKVPKGRIIDVILDIRRASPTFGKWQAFSLNEMNKKILWVPNGFAHGYLSLEDSTIVQYKLTEYYFPSHESGVLWNDSDLGIQWSGNPEEYIISEKDKRLPRLKELPELF